MIATLICAQKLEPAQLKKLEQLIQKKFGKTKLEIELDESLLAGFKLRLDSTQYDLSAKGQLDFLFKQTKDLI